MRACWDICILQFQTSTFMVVKAHSTLSLSNTALILNATLFNELSINDTLSLYISTSRAQALSLFNTNIDDKVKQGFPRGRNVLLCHT